MYSYITVCFVKVCEDKSTLQGKQNFKLFCNITLKMFYQFAVARVILYVVWFVAAEGREHLLNRIFEIINYE